VGALRNARLGRNLKGDEEARESTGQDAEVALPEEWALVLERVA
jgi:hypothetical protein